MQATMGITFHISSIGIEFARSVSTGAGNPAQSHTPANSTVYPIQNICCLHVHSIIHDQPIIPQAETTSVQWVPVEPQLNRRTTNSKAPEQPSTPSYTSAYSKKKTMDKYTRLITSRVLETRYIPIGWK
ncbi:hypothetical protein Nepgr_018007 [Nepenthes gracilis]|uniref:Uncharacterized protein n=1 Tax=Nepenthes gracilis TaxID=150966 RepID=A0AAD3ST16_NEPGR|nr:hypothetical protein Nepgr_018007 [Nepenthes gracilis]